MSSEVELEPIRIQRPLLLVLFGSLSSVGCSLLIVSSDSLLVILPKSLADREEHRQTHWISKAIYQSDRRV